MASSDTVRGSIAWYGGIQVDVRDKTESKSERESSACSSEMSWVENGCADVG